ncbi:Uncharacterized protein TCAP_03544 [Tolypocladium capitatum]|uniref:Uncharacterized protein n=1 Tax=Tolypocladium capitatum TaxID=45235 RepID=A0A2K3QG51_9HYPO|nr:Uncharacterized protein TCAP_03544 [Tolypocladium capitatum]
MDTPASSQHFPPEPLPAARLAAREAARRNEARARGPCRSGCAQLDDYVLLGGGLERGCVVGVSAEEEDAFGLVLGLQVLVGALLDDAAATALVVTPRPAAGVLLRALREGIAAEMGARGVDAAQARGRPAARACLERVRLSCVFDLDGLWEVLADLDAPGGSPPPASIRASAAEASAAAAADRRPARSPVSEIQDSQDEASASSPPSPPPPSPPPRRREADARRPPSVVLVARFSALLTSLFTQREKSAAHTALQLLGAHLRHLSRSLPSHPLVLLLNSTTATPSAGAPPRPPLEPTLRSVFHPPPLPGCAAPAPALRGDKPSFGLVFAQLLDLHLLCARVPRAKDDAAAVTRPAAAAAPRYVTVVEVLLDDMGLWQGGTGHWLRREQRWAAVDVVGGRVVDGFARPQGASPELRL